MKFTDLLLPKWKNSNPAIRLKAVKAISNDNTELLEKILLNDPATEIRIAVIKKITDETILESTSKNDEDETIRKAASYNLNMIFVEKIINSEDNETRIKLLDKINDEELIIPLFAKNNSPDFRISIVKKLSNPKLLCEIAESNCGVKAGELIIAKTNDINLLKRLSQKASSKKIRKKATDKINSQNSNKMQQTVPTPKKTDYTHNLESICGEIESAIASSNLNHISDVMVEAKKEWGQYDPTNQHQLHERFNNSIKALEQQSINLEKIDATIKSFTKICSKVQTLIEQPDINDDDKEQFDILNEEWDILTTDLPENTITIELQTEFKSHIFNFNEKYNSFLIKKEAQNTTIKNLHSICKKLDDILNSDNINITDQNIIVLKKEWASEYVKSEATSKLNEKFSNSLKKYEEKVAISKEIEEQRHKEQLSNLINIVRSASEEVDKELYKLAPDVKNAIKIWKKEKSNDLYKLRDLEFQELCNTFFDRLDLNKKNREWELWSNLSLKEELCSSVEKIALMADKTEELFGYTQLIREAQAKWKEIGPVSKNKSDEIWEKFKSSCDIVFALCLKEKNRLLIEAKEAIELKNYNEASKKIIQIQQSWKKLGSLPLSLEKELRDSFTQICDTFFEKKRNFTHQQDRKRQDNYAIKLNLCEQAEALIESTEWNETTEKYKQFQAKWKKTGPVPREKSDEIWERFSCACNKYFDTLEKTKPFNMVIKEELCEEADTIYRSIDNGLDVWEACKKTIALQKKWNQTGPVTKEHSEPIWARFRTSCDKIFEIREKAKEQLSLDYEKNREKKESLIYQAEAISETPDLKSAADELKKIQEKWKHIGSASRKDEQDLWAKFRKINDLFFNKRHEHFLGREAQRNDNLAKKEDLCLTLELLSKILTDNSDIGYNEKVPLAEQLSKARELREDVDIPGDKKATRTNIMRKVKEIQTEWKKTGGVSPDQENDLWKRYKKAGDLFY